MRPAAESNRKVLVVKRILVAGATGFIGRNIAEAFALREDCRVIGLWHRRPPFDHPAIIWRQADLRDPAAVEAALRDVDIVVQAAATTSGSGDIVRTPSIHVTDNAVMNSYLFRAAHEAGIGHLVFFSCSVMYASGDRPQSEDDYDPGRPLEPRYVGAASTKLYLEQMCRFYAGLGRTRFTVIRHSNVYGPHDKYDLQRSHVFGATVTKVLEGSEDRLVVWGEGLEGRDLMHVDDLVTFVHAALDRQAGPFGLYNAGTGEAVPVRDLVTRIARAAGRPLELVFDTSQPNIPFTVALDCHAAERDLGWRPAITLDAGIVRTVAWRRAQLLQPAGGVKS
jgi:nucleoside-diphosphate-sugar epimerase